MFSLNPMKIAKILIGYCLLWFASGCAAIGPVSSIPVQENAQLDPLTNWNKVAVQFDPDCYNLHTKYDEWGVFIGCQSIDIFDVRTPNVYQLFDEKLSLQNCSTILGKTGQRNYIRTGDQFLFVDKTGQNANAWYVPADYYSDGVSTPDVVREILPGAILDTDSPRTLSAALFHDRYFCLFEYSQFAWSKNRESFPSKLKGTDRAPIIKAYRRKGCANTSFRNGLRTAGASSFISTMFRQMVGLVNPGKSGYCPTRVHTTALSNLEKKLEKLVDVGPIGSGDRSELPGCRPKEVLILCLSKIEALWSLVTVSADDYGQLDGSFVSAISEEWRQVMNRIMCFELQAINGQYDWPDNFKISDDIIQSQCGFIDINLLRSQNEDLRADLRVHHTIFDQNDRVIISPFRAGDFWVEAALMLSQENGPELFLQTVSSLRSIDYAMLAIADWNERMAEVDSL